MITVEIDNDDIRRALRELEDVQDTAMRLYGEKVLEAIIEEHPKKTGESSADWHLEKIGYMQYSAETDNPISEWHLHGTGIYGPRGEPIKPRRAQALKFFWDKIGEMTVWKGDLETPQEKFLFGLWARERGMTPIFAWPKGIPADDYIGRAEDRVEGDNSAQRAMDQAFRMHRMAG